MVNKYKTDRYLNEPKEINENKVRTLDEIF